MSDNAVIDDVIRPVAPSTGAEEIVLAAEQLDYCEVVVGKYMAFLHDENGVRDDRTAVPTILYRFAPTMEQRRKLVMGEDLFLSVMTFGRPAQPLSLQVGPGSFQIAKKIVTLDDDGDRRSPGGIILPP